MVDYIYPLEKFVCKKCGSEEYEGNPSAEIIWCTECGKIYEGLITVGVDGVEKSINVTVDYEEEE